MTDPAAVDAIPAPPPLSLLRQIRLILRGLRASPVRRPLLVLASCLGAIILSTAYGQIWLNHWNKQFFDALSRRDLREFVYQLGVFFGIAGALLVLNVVQRWLVDTFKLRMREGLTLDLVGNWMMPRRAFWLTHAGPIGVNPDQRMSDDTRNLCDLSTDLAVGLLQASILLVSFTGILWVISADFSLRIGGRDIALPGFMVWAALLYAALGSILSFWVGRNLIGRNADRYAREADLRFSLVRINEHLDGISLAAGEADEKRRIELDLAGLLAATRRLVWGHTNLTWVTSGFGWITTVAPILVAAPLFFSGKLSFGGLMAAAAAFTQAQSSLRWFVDNFSQIADWRATLLRVAGFRQALTSDSTLQDFHNRITYEEGAPGTLKIESLVIDSTGGREALQERDIVVASGERVLIVGEPGTGKTTLFRALAGLWPWGTGTVVRPVGETIAYMPRGTPYLPRGTLREVLAYPMKVDAFDEAAFGRALERLGLGRLVAMLDWSRRWDRELSQDEQLGVSFARIVLQGPPWVLVDDAFGALEEEALARVIDVFEHELAGTGVINIGRALQGRDPLFTRTFHLVKASSPVVPPIAAPVAAGTAPP